MTLKAWFSNYRTYTPLHPILAKTRLFFVIAITFILLACSSQQPLVASDPGANQIAQAAIASSRSLQTMAEVEQAALTPKTHVTPPLPASYGMGRIVSMDWSGPIEPLVAQIAHITGYQLKVIGKTPAIPVLVDVYARNEAVGTILRNAAYQADKRANVMLYPHRKLIELRYVKT